VVSPLSLSSGTPNMGRQVPLKWTRFWLKKGVLMVPPKRLQPFVSTRGGATSHKAKTKFFTDPEKYAPHPEGVGGSGVIVPSVLTLRTRTAEPSGSRHGRNNRSTGHSAGGGHRSDLALSLY